MHPPRFVYLASSTVDPQESLIGDATDPWLRVSSKCRHNKKNRWQIEMVIGPFFELSSRFKVEWMREEVSLRKRVLLGCEKARQWRVGVYARDADWIRQMVSTKAQEAIA